MMPWAVPGKIRNITYGNNTQTYYYYDDKSKRLTRLQTLGQSYLQYKTYSYSPSGDISGINDQVNTANYTYAYDSLHRLTEERTNGNISATFTYNAIGNIISKTTGSDTFTYTYHTTKKHAVNSITKNGVNKTFSYDNNGNVIIGWDLSGIPVKRTINYNADNMPTSILMS